MIKFECAETYGWEAAIRGMRNPLNSWSRSDSGLVFSDGEKSRIEYRLGEADLDLMHRLIKAGSDHRKFLRQIMVSVDITAPLYWWKEFDTYKVGTVANSCSTMHTIHKREFTLDDFSHEHLSDIYLIHLKIIITQLNEAREEFLESGDKKDWWQMIQLLPSSYNQTRTVTLNYEVLRNMYHARRTHKLDEWSGGFCHFVESLPYSELITMVY